MEKITFDTLDSTTHNGISIEDLHIDLLHLNKDEGDVYATEDFLERIELADEVINGFINVSEASLESHEGGLTKSAAAAIDIALNGICTDLGIGGVAIPSTESFDDSNERTDLTGDVNESLEGLASKLASGAKNIIIKIWRKIKSFVNSLYVRTKKLKAAFIKLKADAETSFGKKDKTVKIKARMNKNSVISTLGFFNGLGGGINALTKEFMKGSDGDINFINAVSDSKIELIGGKVFVATDKKFKLSKSNGYNKVSGSNDATVTIGMIKDGVDGAVNIINAIDKGISSAKIGMNKLESEINKRILKASSKGKDKSVKKLRKLSSRLSMGVQVLIVTAPVFVLKVLHATYADMAKALGKSSSSYKKSSEKPEPQDEAGNNDDFNSDDFDYLFN